MSSHSLFCFFCPSLRGLPFTLGATVYKDAGVSHSWGACTSKWKVVYVSWTWKERIIYILHRFPIMVGKRKLQKRNEVVNVRGCTPGYTNACAITGQMLSKRELIRRSGSLCLGGHTL